MSSPPEGRLGLRVALAGLSILPSLFIAGLLRPCGPFGFGKSRHWDHIPFRSEEHTSELQSLMRISYAVFCLKKKKEYTKTLTLYYLNHHYTEEYTTIHITTTTSFHHIST